MRTESDNELVNRNESRYRDGTKSLDLRSTGKDEETRSLDGDFEELEAELEWSDNDVKDDTSLSNVSLSSSGRNENEASAGGQVDLHDWESQGSNQDNICRLPSWLQRVRINSHNNVIYQKTDAQLMPFQWHASLSHFRIVNSQWCALFCIDHDHIKWRVKVFLSHYKAHFDKKCHFFII